MRKADPYIFSSRTRPAGKACDWPECQAEGEHRAPKKRDGGEDYFWFCTDHVREYNKNWNYFADMSPEEIEAFQHGVATWHRDTWKSGVNPDVADASTAEFRDDMDIMGAAGFGFGRASEQGDVRPPIGEKEVAALAVLNLSWPVNLTEIKTQYKKLAKAHHPDLNKGDRKSEDRLKDINQAYSFLMSCDFAQT